MSKRSDKKLAKKRSASGISTEKAPISKDDLEAKFRQIKSEVDTVAGSAKNKAVPAALAGGILIVLIMFLMGKRVGKKKSSIVQIRRI